MLSWVVWFGGLKTTANKYLILIVLVGDFNSNLFQHVDVVSARIGHKADRGELFIVIFRLPILGMGSGM